MQLKIIKTNNEKIDKILLSKILFSINIVCFILILIFGIALTITSTQCVFPERYFIHEMNYFMFKGGEAIYLVMIYLTASIGILCIITSIVCAILLVSLIFLTYDYFKVIKQLGNAKIKLFTVLIFFYIPLSIIFVVFMTYYLTIFWNNKKCKNNVINLDDNNYKNYKFYLKISITLSILVSVITPIITTNAVVINKLNNIKNVPYLYDKALDMYTMSENEPNTLVLYFDRGMGILFNFLFIIDYLLYGNNSFIKKYPEFTSYVNVLSNGSNTISSNSSIHGSWEYLPFLKNSTFNNPTLNVPNDTLNFNQWYAQSYSTIVKLLDYYNYKNYSLLCPPYYGAYGSNNNYLYANSNLFQTSLLENVKKYNNKTNINVNVMDVSELSNAINQKIKLTEDDEFIIIRNFASYKNTSMSNNIIDGHNYGKNIPYLYDKINKKPLNLSVSKNKGSSFLFQHFYTTHEPYKIISDKNISDKNNPYQINCTNPSIGTNEYLPNGPDALLVCIWYAIQKLKIIMDYLKNLPYNGVGSDIIKNQYDNTNIYIISDHGQGMDFNTITYNNIFQFLKKHNYINDNQINYISNLKTNNQDFKLACNAVFVAKPAKFIHNSWNKNITNNIKDFFNNDRLLTLADFVPILDANLQKVKYDRDSNNTLTNFEYNINNSFFNINKTYNYKNNEIINNFININKIYNPLEYDLNTVNNRLIPMIGNDWYYYENNKKYTIYYARYFKKNNNVSELIFNNNNFHNFN